PTKSPPPSSARRWQSCVPSRNRNCPNWKRRWTGQAFPTRPAGFPTGKGDVGPHHAPLRALTPPHGHNSVTGDCPSPEQVRAEGRNVETISPLPRLRRGEGHPDEQIVQRGAG